MSIRLDTDEAWAFLAAGHTGILTSLRSDGWPVSLPVWFVAFDGAIYVSTPSHTAKVARVKKDDRVSFLVESGTRWKELKSVVVTGRANIVTNGEELERVAQALEEKYSRYRTARTSMPDASKKHYGTKTTVLRITPAQDFLTWDNSKLRLKK